MSGVISLSVTCVFRFFSCKIRSFEDHCINIFVILKILTSEKQNEKLWNDSELVTTVTRRQQKHLRNGADKNQNIPKFGKSCLHPPMTLYRKTLYPNGDLFDSDINLMSIILLRCIKREKAAYIS